MHGLRRGRSSMEGGGKTTFVFATEHYTVRVNLIGDLGKIRETRVRVQIHACSIRRTLTR